MRNLVPVLLVGLCLSAASPLQAAKPDIFVGDEPLTLTLTAPLEELFTHAKAASDYRVKGQLAWSGPGGSATLDNVIVSERGHTSRQASECAFPKLKLDLGESSRAGTPFEGIHALKLGTHCDERADDDLTPKYGRLANERAPAREALVYRLLEAAGIPTLMARPARMTYVFSDAPDRAPLTRLALLLEDDDEAEKRVGGSGRFTEDNFGSAREQLNPRDTARLVFAEALIGNFDWCLRMFGGDIYRCDERHPVWNVLAIERQGLRALPLIYDFDLSGPVVGRHVWFDQVFSADYALPPSTIGVEVQAQVQRARSLFDRALLDETRRHFLSARAAVTESIARSPADDRGKQLATQYVDAFYAAIETDGQFYSPVVVEGGQRAFLDPDQARPACGAWSVLPVGTPVSAPLEVRGDYSRVRVLDALWEWVGDKRCDAVHRQPVWIASSAIGTQYPR